MLVSSAESPLTSPPLLVRFHQSIRPVSKSVVNQNWTNNNKANSKWKAAIYGSISLIAKSQHPTLIYSRSFMVSQSNHSSQKNNQPPQRTSATGPNTAPHHTFTRSFLFLAQPHPSAHFVYQMINAAHGTRTINAGKYKSNLISVLWCRRQSDNIKWLRRTAQRAAPYSPILAFQLILDTDRPGRTAVVVQSGRFMFRS